MGADDEPSSAGDALENVAGHHTVGAATDRCADRTLWRTADASGHCNDVIDACAAFDQ
jgi:hypothetical protein